MTPLGDDWPTDEGRLICPARAATRLSGLHYQCTLEPDHDGPHEAGVGGGRPPVHTWTDPEAVDTVGFVGLGDGEDSAAEDMFGDGLGRTERRRR